MVDFEDNTLLSALFGDHDQNLVRLEDQLGVSLTTRGNRVLIGGDPQLCERARGILQGLYQRLEMGRPVGRREVDDAIRLGDASEAASHLVIQTRKRPIQPRSPNQIHYARNLLENELVFGIGPAGTGKTYLAVAAAVNLMLARRVDRIVLSRPAVEAGERLGFLPGDMREKVDPYLRPLYDALYDMLPAEQVAKKLETGEIEIAPLAFMRGRTLANAFVILDEAQNTTPVQMKMLLTRLGENSRMAITGDLSQVDLPRGTKSGLREAIEVLADIDEIAFTTFDDRDVVRHPLVTKIVRAYARQPELFEGGREDKGN
ncbi:PhoH family protein [Minwuia thermotolerans]|uniref:PhoH-like protein n=1 Tax=Minwuia thermotolerans TaxID=2056226 RepID=A0A2M9G290_9PROT|nr:PhoH family protein [Minwuia thermotolerans]PJK29794.1 phosphate starvation-inducible protein PhoH [Minwuia thermotolerans]